jgi:hypothetical protein
MAFPVPFTLICNRIVLRYLHDLEDIEVLCDF